HVRTSRRQAAAGPGAKVRKMRTPGSRLRTFKARQAIHRSSAGISKCEESRMRKIALYSGTALAMAISSNANAEPFNGPFIGIQAGWTQHDAGIFGKRIGDVTANRSQDSVSGGAFLGYDYRISPRFVIGAEAGLNFGIDDNFFRTTD